MTTRAEGFAPPGARDATGDAARPRWRAAVLAGIAYAVVAVYCTWPLARGLSHRVIVRASGEAVADALTDIWVLGWTAHALGTDPARVLDGNALYPARGVVLRSERLLANQPVFAPLWMGTGNPVLGFNAVVLVSLLLSALLMYLLTRRWTASAAGAFVAGLTFAFAPWRTADPADAAGLQLHYLPAALLLIEWAMIAGRGGPAVLAGGSLALLALCSRSAGTTALIVAAAYAIARLTLRDPRPPWRVLATTLIPAAVVLLLLFTYGGEGAVWPQSWPNAAAPGVVAAAHAGWSVLAAIGVLSLAGAGAGATRPRILCLLLVSGVGWVLPAAAALGLGGLAGFGVARLEAWTRSGSYARRLAVGAAVAAVVGPMLLRPALHAEAVPTGEKVPEVYRWLASHGEGGPLLELSRRGDGSGAWAMYFSTYHWLPLLNGHAPESSAYAFLDRYADQLPTPGALQMLVDCSGLRWVLIHDLSTARRQIWGGTAGVRMRGGFPHDHALPDVLFEVLLSPRPGCRSRLIRGRTTIAGSPLRRPLELRARLLIADLPESLPAGGETRVTVTVHNETRDVLPGTALDPADRVALSVRWIDVNRRRLTAVDEILLPADVLPARVLTFAAWLRHPTVPGDYLLAVIARQGGEADGGSEARFEKQLTVRPAPPTPGPDPDLTRVPPPAS